MKMPWSKQRIEKGLDNNTYRRGCLRGCNDRQKKKKRPVGKGTSREATGGAPGNRAVKNKQCGGAQKGRKRREERGEKEEKKDIH